MIRKLQKSDINNVAAIWLATNLKTHYFISAQYWKTNFELVKEMLPQAEVYVYKKNKKIQGFIGLNGEYIEGIFVSSEMQSQGIGKLLLNYAKNRKTKLLLHVYQKNTRAIHFYQREGFEIQCESLDEANREMYRAFSEKHNPDGEIIFLAADPNSKIKGIGTALLSALKKDEHGKLVYLYTDNACTYQFYEHRGFSKSGEQQVVLNLGKKEVPLTCFLYAKN